MDTVLSESIGFNPAPSTVMHIDLNSCFAIIEQQANPFLRGKPVVVGAYTTDNGCILAASPEAKEYGVKTGMRVKDGRMRCPHLIVKPGDPNKYRYVNRKLLALFQSYTAEMVMKSIDEAVLHFFGSPGLYKRMSEQDRHSADWRIAMTEKEHISAAMLDIGQEIKRRIKEEIGDWLTVSIGIAPNRFLAKTASGLSKPDGLDEINARNITKTLDTLELEDLYGINVRYGERLRRYGIVTPRALYETPIKPLKNAFHSVIGYHWWLRLHGWEADDRQFRRKTIGHSYALRIPLRPTDERLHQILCQLVEKMGGRLRKNGYTAQGVHISCSYRNYKHWGHGEKQPAPLFANRDLYRQARTILLQAPDEPVRILAVRCYLIEKDLYTQLTIDTDEMKKRDLTDAIDTIHARWGDFVIHPARMMKMEHKVLDRIAFGGVKDLPRVVYQERIRSEASV